MRMLTRTQLAREYGLGRFPRAGPPSSGSREHAKLHIFEMLHRAKDAIAA